MTIIFVGILGAIISAVIGTFWYSKSTPMGKWHMQYLGFDKLSSEDMDKLVSEAKPKMKKVYLAQMILSFITSFFIAFVANYIKQNGDTPIALFYTVFLIWFSFTLPMVGQNILWGKVDSSLAWKKFISDNLYNLITFVFIAFVAALFV